jgi:transcriptional regulator with XRE-family HTH domain
MTTESKMTAKTLRDIEKITGTQLTLGKLLWAIREADDSSQVDFADKLDISRQQLCDIEHGRKTVSPKLAAKYAEILGYSKEQFIRLALQDLVDREGLNVQVEISPKRRKKYHESQIAA